MMDLRLGWCSYEAAQVACHAWHYSHSMPTGKMVRIGAWEGRFIGCVIFSRGSCTNIGRPFGLAQSEVCELTRVALAAHRTPTSRIVAVALRMLRRLCPGLKLVVSYADPEHGHDGRGIYAAGNWQYVGLTASECLLRIHGRLRHPRSVGSLYGTRSVSWLRQHVDAGAERVVLAPKHKYVYPLDDAMRARLAPLSKPYPKRERSRENAAAGPPAEAGVIPSRSLHQIEVAHG